MASLSLVSVNIEYWKHLDLVLSFLSARRPEVVCVQELMEYDIARFEAELGMSKVFAPSKIHPAAGRPGIEGVGIFSSLPVRTHATKYYRGNADFIPEFDLTSAATKHATSSEPALFCDVEKEGEVFRIATTHFTWTPDGQADDFQCKDMRSMLTVLETVGDFVLTGDFNAPRGGEIWQMLADKYKDNIPSRYATSIDGSLHRAGALQLVVDGIFSTPEYLVSDVELVSGVSDHCAVVAKVGRESI